MVASSSDLQQSKGGATRRRQKTERGIGKKPKRTLPPEINWVRTWDRFYWEMIEIYLLQSSGGLPTPEAAYARISEFITEDLHQSVSYFFYCDRDHHLTNSLIWRQPLSVKGLGVRPVREQEQYLTGVLNVLYPTREGEKRDVQRLFDQGNGVIRLEVRMDADLTLASYSRG